MDITGTLTEPQANLLRKLVIELGHGDERCWPSVSQRYLGLSKRAASATIDGLIRETKRRRAEGMLTAAVEAHVTAERPAPLAPAVTPGYYAIDDDVYVVVNSKAGKPYAKRLYIPPATGRRRGPQADGRKKARWIYQAGSVYSLVGLKPLTIEHAARLGHLHGVCVVCATLLTDPDSVQWGIGPDCYRNITGCRRPKFATTQVAQLDLEGAAV